MLWERILRYCSFHELLADHHINIRKRISLWIFTYYFGEVSGKRPCRIVGESRDIVNNRSERNARTCSIILIRLQEGLDVSRADFLHTSQLCFGSHISATKLASDEREVCSRRVVAWRWSYGRRWIHNHSSNNWIVGVWKVIVIGWGSTSGLTPERDLGCISSEVRDIGPDPFQRKSLIQETEIQFWIDSSCNGISEDV